MNPETNNIQMVDYKQLISLHIFFPHVHNVHNFVDIYETIISTSNTCRRRL